jgi:hypothetical protein
MKHALDEANDCERNGGQLFAEQAVFSKRNLIKNNV